MTRKRKVFKVWAIQWEDGWFYREAIEGFPKLYPTKKAARAERAVSWVFARPVRLELKEKPQ